MKTSKISKGLIAILVVAGLISNSTVAFAKTPTDISSSWAKTEITTAASQGWALMDNGYFYPNKAATREEVIWMLVGACYTVKTDKFSTSKKADLSVYTDTDQLSEFAKVRMAEAVGNGLITGYGDGTLKPQGSITRAEFAVIIGRLIDKDAVYQEQSLPFTDSIPTWAYNNLMTSYKNGIIKGYDDGTFRPNAKVTKAEALVMISRWQKLNTLKSLPTETIIAISQILPSAEFSNDNSTLIYYGPNGKTKTNAGQKFYVTQTRDGILHIIVYDSKGDSYPQLKLVLEYAIPSSADKVISLLKSPPKGITEFTSDKHQVSFALYGMYCTITIE